MKLKKKNERNRVYVLYEWKRKRMKTTEKNVQVYIISVYEHCSLFERRQSCGYDLC